MGPDTAALLALGTWANAGTSSVLPYCANVIHRTRAMSVPAPTERVSLGPMIVSTMWVTLWSPI